MIHKLVVCTALLLLCLLPSGMVHGQGKGIGKTKNSHQQHMSSVNGYYPHVRLVVVGVNEYFHGDFQRLQFAETDAITFSRIMLSCYKNIDHVSLLTGKQATSEAIVDELTDACKNSEAVILFLSCHGQTLIGNSQSSENTTYIIPYVGKLYCNQASSTIETGKCLQLQSIRDVFHRHHVKNYVIVADFCDSGAFAETKSPSRSVDIAHAVSTAERYFLWSAEVLAAARVGTEALEDTEHKRGFFAGAVTDYLKLKASDHASFTSMDLFNGVVNVVKEATRGHQNGPQHPDYANFYGKSNQGHFAFQAVRPYSDGWDAIRSHPQYLAGFRAVEKGQIQQAHKLLQVFADIGEPHAQEIVVPQTGFRHIPEVTIPLANKDNRRATPTFKPQFDLPITVSMMCYEPEAKRGELQIMVFPSGSASVKVATSSGSKSLDDTVLKYVEQWRWAPALVARRPATDVYALKFDEVFPK